jgi:outer membrane protein assembly factor BamE (lipoprotein component of BamABCDE complex)
LRRANEIIAGGTAAPVDNRPSAAEGAAGKSGTERRFQREARPLRWGIMGISHRSCAVVAAVAALALAGCAPDIQLRGDLPAKDQIGRIHPGKTTKDEVTKILGSPSSVGVFDPNAWYYISKRTSQSAFFLPETTDQQVYIVDFNKDGVVSAVDHKGLKDAENIVPAPGATPAPGRELSFLEQILGNLNRFAGATGVGGGSSGGPIGPNDANK